MEPTLCPKVKAALNEDDKMPTPYQSWLILEFAKQASLQTRCLIELFHYTGCRVSEAIALRRDHVCNIDNYIVLKTLKQRKGMCPLRAVKVPAEFIKRLLSLPVCSEQRFFSFTRWTARRRVAKITEQANVTGAAATTRAFRHRFITALDKAGLDKTTSKALAGHKTDTSHQIYIHPTKLSPVEKAEFEAKMREVWKTGYEGETPAPKPQWRDGMYHPPTTPQYALIPSDIHADVLDDPSQTYKIVPVHLLTSTPDIPLNANGGPG